MRYIEIEILVKILNCFPKFAYHIEASFIVARGQSIDPDDNDTNPVVSNQVIIACNLNGRWEATVSSTIGNRNEVKELQCITSRDQTMNHISPYFTEIYR
ncbi:hypothetical protein DINM_001738 [Dirofilaria immitis]|nr:hypothetical protein [Dirofilaria immitis]